MAKASPPPPTSSISQTTSASSNVEFDTAAAEPVSSSRTATNLFIPTAAMTNLFLSTSSSSSSSPVTSSTVTTGIVRENSSCQNYDTKKKNEDAATSPSPSSSVKPFSEVKTKATNTAAMMMPSPPSVATADAAETPPPSMQDPQDECVLCCYPFPIKNSESCYKECCGELICMGCIIAERRTLIIGTNVKKPIKGSKEEELEFTMIPESEQAFLCPFCRAEVPTNDKEYLKSLWKQIDEYNDPKAMGQLGSHYVRGVHGLSKNIKKAEELHQRAYDLCDPIAAYDLANLYTKHIPDQARMMKYLEEGVERGNAHCMNKLAILAAQSGNHEEAKRQFMTAALSGHDQAMDNLMVNYQSSGSVVSKEDLVTTLRAHKAVNDKGKSEPREYAYRLEAFEEKNKNRSAT